MATVEKEKEEKYYELKDVHKLQIERLRKLGVREEDLEKTREKILDHARDILNNMAMQFTSLAKKIDIAESLNSDDFGRIYKKLNSPIPSTSKLVNNDCALTPTNGTNANSAKLLNNNFFI